MKDVVEKLEKIAAELEKEAEKEEDLSRRIGKIRDLYTILDAIEIVTERDGE